MEVIVDMPWVPVLAVVIGCVACVGMRIWTNLDHVARVSGHVYSGVVIRTCE